MSRTFRKNPLIPVWSEDELNDAPPRERVKYYIHRHTDGIWRDRIPKCVRRQHTKRQRREATMELQRSEDPIIQQERFVRCSDGAVYW